MLPPSRTFWGKLGLILILAAGSAQARPVWEPVGLAAYTETSRDIYVAALLMPPGGNPRDIVAAPGPKDMEYRIATRRVSKRGFASMMLLQAEMGSGTRAPQVVTEAFNKLMSNMKGPLLRGDHFVIALSADNLTTFFLNDATLLSGGDRSVFDFFFAGWVGESSSTLLRDSLLAGTLDPALLSRYEALRPGQDRIAAIEAWIAPAAIVATTPPQNEKAAAPEVPDSEPAVVEVEPDSPATNTTEAADMDNGAAREPVVALVAIDSATAVPATPEPGPASGATTSSLETAVIAAVLAVEGAAEPGDKASPDLVAAVEHAQAVATRTTAMQHALEVENEGNKIQYQRQLDRYMTHVMEQVFVNVDYPRRAVARQRQGKVELLARLDKSGELLDVTLDNSSGYTALDDAARRAVRRAAPFPALPPEALEEFGADDGESYVVTIPVTFKLLN